MVINNNAKHSLQEAALCETRVLICSTVKKMIQYLVTNFMFVYSLYF